MLAYLVSGPAALGSIPSVPEFFSEEKNVNVVQVNQRPCLKESEEWPENVY